MNIKVVETPEFILPATKWGQLVGLAKSIKPGQSLLVEGLTGSEAGKAYRALYAAGIKASFKKSGFDYYITVPEPKP